MNKIEEELLNLGFTDEFIKNLEIYRDYKIPELNINEPDIQTLENLEYSSTELRV